MKLQIEYGEQYRRRDGKPTDPMTSSGNVLYPWEDPRTGRLYTDDGRYFGLDSEYDLIEKYYGPDINP